MSYCYFCESSLTVGAIPLFKPSRNEEFSEKLGGTSESFILSEVLKSVGINIDSAAASLPPVCKKCARKIVNCCTQFHEVERLFKMKNTARSQEEATDGGEKTSPRQFLKWADSKRQENKRDFTRKIGTERQIRENALLNKFYLVRARSLEDEIANLMCLPMTESNSSSSVVKVFLSVLYFLVMC